MNKEDEERLLSDLSDRLVDAVIHASDSQSGDFFEEWHFADVPEKHVERRAGQGGYRR